jgi:hypothetical protein
MRFVGDIRRILALGLARGRSLGDLAKIWKFLAEEPVEGPLIILLKSSVSLYEGAMGDIVM